MIRETSAGTIVFRNSNSDLVFLLLHYPTGHWDFVKGKMEKDETPSQTTIREAEEETGIKDLEFVGNFKETIEYEFQHEGQTIFKKVIFFLAKTNTKEIILSNEHLDYVWLDFDHAYEKITYENAKLVLSKANELLKSL